jgi:hypothetical protein
MELMNANFEFVTCAKLSVVEMHNIGSPTITLLNFLTILEKFANFVKLEGFNGHHQGSCTLRWNKDGRL